MIHNLVSITFFLIVLGYFTCMWNNLLRLICKIQISSSLPNSSMALLVERIEALEWYHRILNTESDHARRVRDVTLFHYTETVLVRFQEDVKEFRQSRFWNGFLDLCYVYLSFYGVNIRFIQDKIGYYTEMVLVRFQEDVKGFRQSRFWIWFVHLCDLIYLNCDQYSLHSRKPILSKKRTRIYGSFKFGVNVVDSRKI